MEYSWLQLVEGFETVRLWLRSNHNYWWDGICNVLSTEAWLVGEGREKILINFETIFWPNRTWSELCLLGALHWKKCLRKMHAFVTSKDEDSLEVNPTVSIWYKDPFMQIRSNLTRKTRMRRKSQSQDYDPCGRHTGWNRSKGKTIATSLKKVEKNKEPQTSKVPKEKRKLSYAVSSDAKKAKVCFKHLPTLR